MPITISSTLEQANTGSETLTEYHWNTDACSRNPNSIDCYCLRNPYTPSCCGKIPCASGGGGFPKPKPKPRTTNQTPRPIDNTPTPRDIIEHFFDTGTNLTEDTDTGSTGTGTGSTGTGTGGSGTTGGFGNTGGGRVVRRARISKDMQPLVLGLGIIVLVIIANKVI